MSIWRWPREDGETTTKVVSSVSAVEKKADNGHADDKSRGFQILVLISLLENIFFHVAAY